MMLSGAPLILSYVRDLPQSSGVYRMLDAHGVVLYVGKAKDLQKRVFSYTKPHRQSLRIAHMISLTHSMIFVHTATEAEALLLEADLIKTLKPKYNILFRDDKSFSYITLSKGHDFPRFAKSYGQEAKSADAFGPYFSGTSLYHTFSLLQQIFRLRTCTDYVFRSRSRPCLLYQLKRCSAPCTRYISKEAYALDVRHAKDFLRGKDDAVIVQLHRLMTEASTQRLYEKARDYRNQLRHLQEVQEGQRVRLDSTNHADMIALVRHGTFCSLAVFVFRHGINHGTHTLVQDVPLDISSDDILSTFLTQFYSAHPPPPIVYMDSIPSDSDTLSHALYTRFLVPKGSARPIFQQVIHQASLSLKTHMEKHQQWHNQFYHLQQALSLPLLRRIEAFDNSHLQGQDVYGAVVSASDTGFDKSLYRLYTLKDASIKGQDDYGILTHVLNRHILHWSDASPPPDLLLIDGGANHARLARRVLDDAGYPHVPLCALAKGETRHNRTDVLYDSQGTPIPLANTDDGFLLVERMRNEVHRFVLHRQRGKRLSGSKSSVLDSIAGIGATRKKVLLLHFGSVAKIAEASIASLALVPGISRGLATTIYQYFHPESQR